MRVAYALGLNALPKYSSRFSRRDFNVAKAVCLSGRSRAAEQKLSRDRRNPQRPRPGRHGSRLPQLRAAARQRVATTPETGKQLTVALADAGFDSDANHGIARQDLDIRSLIKPSAGRPSFGNRRACNPRGVRRSMQFEIIKAERARFELALRFKP